VSCASMRARRVCDIVLVCAAMLAVIGCDSKTNNATTGLSPAEANSIAPDAYVYGYPLVHRRYDSPGLNQRGETGGRHDIQQSLMRSAFIGTNHVSIGAGNTFPRGYPAPATSKRNTVAPASTNLRAEQFAVDLDGCAGRCVQKFKPSSSTTVGSVKPALKM
jgi:hypothetical protein